MFPVISLWIAHKTSYCFTNDKPGTQFMYRVRYQISRLLLLLSKPSTRRHGFAAFALAWAHAIKHNKSQHCDCHMLERDFTEYTHDKLPCNRALGCLHFNGILTQVLQAKPNFGDLLVHRQLLVEWILPDRCRAVLHRNGICLPSWIRFLSWHPEPKEPCLLG